MLDSELHGLWLMIVFLSPRAGLQGSQIHLDLSRTWPQGTELETGGPAGEGGRARRRKAKKSPLVLLTHECKGGEERSGKATKDLDYDCEKPQENTEPPGKDSSGICTWTS